jgi:two-component system LytT family response regulator
MAQLQTIASPERKSAIIRNLAPAITDRLGVSTQDGLVIIQVGDILYCEAMSNYCRLHLRDGSSMVASRTLKHVFACLPHSAFIRTHQSYVVRIDEVIRIHHELTLRNGTKIPIARSQRHMLNEWFQSQLSVI